MGLPQLRTLLTAALLFTLWITPLGAAGTDIVLPGLNGGQLAEADLANGSQVIVVWASWSPHCRDIVERVNRLNATWSSKARISTVVFQESPDKIRAFLHRKSMSAPIFLDTDGMFSKKHAITSLPGLLIIDNGRVAYNGKLPPNPDSLLSQTF